MECLRSGKMSVWLEQIKWKIVWEDTGGVGVQIRVPYQPWFSALRNWVRCLWQLHCRHLFPLLYVFTFPNCKVYFFLFLEFTDIWCHNIHFTFLLNIAYWDAHQILPYFYHELQLWPMDTNRVK